jgi:hypothetical protein
MLDFLLLVSLSLLNQIKVEIKLEYSQLRQVIRLAVVVYQKSVCSLALSLPTLELGASSKAAWRGVALIGSRGT